MNRRVNLLVGSFASIAALAWAAGCSKQSAAPQATSGKSSSTNDHQADEHQAADHHEGDSEHAHGGHAMSEADVSLPATFSGGVTQLAELHKKIGELIEHGELAEVHHAAEEMAIIARKMKELAQRDVDEGSRTEAGRLCNEVAGYFEPIDQAADAGNKTETVSIHKQMAATLARLQELSGKTAK